MPIAGGPLPDALARTTMYIILAQPIRTVPGQPVFSDLNLFHMKNDRMEYEANCFAAEVALPDDEVLNYIQEGFNMEKIAKSMNTDINLVAMKAANLNRKGYSFRLQDSRSDFLKF